MEPLIASAWVVAVSRKITSPLLGIWPAVLLVAVLAVGLFGVRSLFRMAESSFRSLNSLAVEPIYVACREGFTAPCREAPAIAARSISARGATGQHRGSGGHHHLFAEGHTNRSISAVLKLSVHASAMLARAVNGAITVEPAGNADMGFIHGFSDLAGTAAVREAESGSSRPFRFYYSHLAYKIRKRPFLARGLGFDAYWLPVPRQEFVETAGGMAVGHALQDVAEPGKGLAVTPEV
jgi:hypothetical protein